MVPFATRPVIREREGERGRGRRQQHSFRSYDFAFRATRTIGCERLLIGGSW